MGVWLTLTFAFNRLCVKLFGLITLIASILLMTLFTSLNLTEDTRVVPMLICLLTDTVSTFCFLNPVFSGVTFKAKLWRWALLTVFKVITVLALVVLVFKGEGLAVALGFGWIECLIGVDTRLAYWAILGTGETVIDLGGTGLALGYVEPGCGFALTLIVSTELELGFFVAFGAGGNVRACQTTEHNGASLACSLV